MIKCPHCGKERPNDGPNHRDWGCGCEAERKSIKDGVTTPKPIPCDGIDWRENFR